MGVWLRVFVALLFAVLPPILLLVGAVILGNSLLREAGPTAVAALVVTGAIAWAAILGIVFARTLGTELRAMVTIAERGHAAGEKELGGTPRQLASALEERDHQVSALATAAGDVPIDADPTTVVHALVTMTRSVMRDPTWRCAILTSDSPDLLPPGRFSAPDDRTPSASPDELAAWASTALAATGAPAARVSGPWGAFAVVDISVSERLHGVLYAPWEGRADPSPAEVALLTLVGQHAGTAIEHSLLYAQVRTQADQLEQLALIQGDFLRGVTHDLQTPLTAIGALAAELAASPTLGAQERVDLDAIVHQSVRLRRMVGQLLVASRLEAQAITATNDLVRTAPLIESVCRAIRPSQHAIDVQLGSDALVLADADRLEQVLWALLDNAIKYSSPRSTIRVRFDLESTGASRSGRDPGPIGAIRISDTGIGMDPATIAKATTQFFRGSDARRLVPDGSGIGLYAAKGLVELMGGTLDIQSRLGAGTTVTVRLPAETTEEEASFQPTSSTG